MRTVAITILMLCFSWAVHAEETRYVFSSKKQESQFSHLITQLRCVVCQNQDLAESNAALAIDLKDRIYQWVLAGKTDQEIIHYLTTRYGDFILLKPPVKPMTWFLWFGPLLFLTLGLVIFKRWFGRYSYAA
ncbi:MAG: cytochrome c-type biogenesis protein CcmH [Legionella sp.]|nr:cytochrome c-type biogenesis protein CcmH [Legionella sp.]